MCFSKHNKYLVFLSAWDPLNNGIQFSLDCPSSYVWSYQECQLRTPLLPYQRSRCITQDRLLQLSLTRNVDLQGNPKRIKVVRAETFQRQRSKQATHEFPGYVPPLILLIIQQTFMSVCCYVQSTVVDAKDTTAQRQRAISRVYISGRRKQQQTSQI